MLQRNIRPRSIACVAILTLSLGACASRIETHGNPVDLATVNKVLPNTHSKDDVLSVLGSPSSISPFVDSTWYYISARMEGVAFLPDREVQRQIVAIRFDQENRVDRIDILGIDQGRKVEIVDRETPSFGEDRSLMQDFLRNVGRFEKQTPSQRR